MDGYVTEFDFWSPILGSDATRISMANDEGLEYFAIVRRLEGRAWRELKAKAVAALTDAMDAGVAPGEIRWR